MLKREPILLGDAPNRSATSFAVRPDGQSRKVSRMQSVLFLITASRPIMTLQPIPCLSHTLAACSRPSTLLTSSLKTRACRSNFRHGRQRDWAVGSTGNGRPRVFCELSFRSSAAFLGAPPPVMFKHSYNAVNRQDANVPAWYAPNSRWFIQLDDEFVAHATHLAPCKRLPEDWHIGTPSDSFGRDLGLVKLWVVAADYGWLIERECFGGKTEVLASLLADAPVLCDSYGTAARLADAAHQGLPKSYALDWISTA